MILVSAYTLGFAMVAEDLVRLPFTLLVALEEVLIPIPGMEEMQVALVVVVEVDAGLDLVRHH